jgi:hypothetical protein
MFGTILVNKKMLSKPERAEYRAAYCGLCHALSEAYGKQGERTLSYDLTFLVLLIESVEKGEIIQRRETCTMHPLRRIAYNRDPAARYAAAMNSYLYYLKQLDDIRDEGSVSARRNAGYMESVVHDIRCQYPEQTRRMDSAMKELVACEQRQEINPDVPTRLFGEVLAAAFSYPGEYCSQFERIGDALGRMVYLEDAACDLRDDLKHQLYNPLTTIPSSSYRAIMSACLLPALETLRTLPAEHHRRILENILCSGIWTKFDCLYPGSTGETEHA